MWGLYLGPGIRVFGWCVHTGNRNPHAPTRFRQDQAANSPQKKLHLPSQIPCFGRKASAMPKRACSMHIVVAARQYVFDFNEKEQAVWHRLCLSVFFRRWASDRAKWLMHPNILVSLELSTSKQPKSSVMRIGLHQTCTGLCHCMSEFRHPFLFLFLECRHLQLCHRYENLPAFLFF